MKGWLRVLVIVVTVIGLTILAGWNRPDPNYKGHFKCDPPKGAEKLDC